MFVVSEAEAAAIRTALRAGRRVIGRSRAAPAVPGVDDNAQARECARTIAGWKPLPVPLRRVPRAPGRDRSPASRLPVGVRHPLVPSWSWLVPPPAFPLFRVTPQGKHGDEFLETQRLARTASPGGMRRLILKMDSEDGVLPPSQFRVCSPGHLANRETMIRRMQARPVCASTSRN